MLLEAPVKIHSNMKENYTELMYKEKELAAFEEIYQLYEVTCA